MLWINNAKIIAAFAVIMLHISSYFLYNSYLDFNWWTANLFDSSARWCVPVFVMISGYLLLSPEKNYTTLDFYKKRINRIIIPLIFWTVFFLAWTIFVAKINKLPSPQFYHLLKQILRGSPYPHMWYLYMIISLYIFTPFLRKLVLTSSRKELFWLTAILFIISCITTIANDFSHSNSSIFLTWFLYYLPYFIAGYLIGYNKASHNTSLNLTIFILSVIATAAGCFVLTRSFDLTTGLYFYKYLSITVIPMSLSFFSICRHFDKAFFGDYNLSKLASLPLLFTRFS